MKTPQQLEKHMKGAANHRRIDILFLLKKTPGLTLEQIGDHLKCDFNTIAPHTRNLLNAGLLYKKYQGRYVLHTLSPLGEKTLAFLKSI